MGFTPGGSWLSICMVSNAEMEVFPTPNVMESTSRWLLISTIRFSISTCSAVNSLARSELPLEFFLDNVGEFLGNDGGG